MFGNSLLSRHRRPEMMDQGDLDEQGHVWALQGLERINRLSAGGRLLWPAIRQAGEICAPRVLSVLDVATGAGDIPIGLWLKAQRANLPAEISACDRSATALAYARRRAEEQNASVRFFQWDILNGPLPDTYDVVTCSQFLHHLAEDETVQALRTMAQAARHLVVIHDLRRCLTGWWLAYLVTRLMSASPVVRADGPVSVEGAYTDAEILRLAERAGMNNATLARHWPCRFLLTWWKPPGGTGKVEGERP